MQFSTCFLCLVPGISKCVCTLLASRISASWSIYVKSHWSSNQLRNTHLPGVKPQSYPEKAIKPTWPPSLQCRVKPTKTPLPYPKNQSFPEQSSVYKLTKRQRYLKLKCPASAGRAEILSRPQPVKFCRCYKEKCLVCRAVSEPFITHVSEANKKHVPVPLFSRELKHFYKSYKKKQSKYNTLYGNMSDSDITTYNSDGESDREVIIFCNIKCKEDIYKNSRNN